VSDLNIRWWGAFNPVAQSSDLSFVLELIPLEEECSEGFAIVTHLCELLAATEV